MDARFEILKGKTLKSIVGKVGDEEMIFETISGEKFRLYYQED